MSPVSSASGNLLSGEAKMTDSAGEAEVTVAGKSKMSLRTGKRLSKQEVIEEPYDSEPYPNVGNEEKELGSRENEMVDKTEKTEAPLSIATNRSVPPRSLSSRPKMLVRSQALCGEDDVQYGFRFNGLPLGTTTRSSASSLSHDSSQDVYTDSTGIDLQSFIVNTLHKNMKDRQMLLQLEQQMKALINDSSRNSQKFPAMSSYNRMLVHRVAAFFGLDHNVDQSGTAVVVNKNSQTRIPSIEFVSLIGGDNFTDEPRKYLKRNVQSYEEGRHRLVSDLMSDRRAHSFDCEYAGANGVPPACPLPINPVQMSVYSVTGSNSSSDIMGHQLLESSGSCYSYGEVQPIAVRASMESGAVYGGFPIPQVYQWNASDNYGGFTPGTDLPSSIITSAAPSSSGVSVLGTGRNIKKAASIDTERSLHNNAGNQIMGDQRTIPLRRSMTALERRRPDLLTVREPSIPEHTTVSSGLPEPLNVPTWQPSVFDAARVEPSCSNQYFIGPQCAPSQGFVQCIQTNIPTTRSDIQCVTQQMNGLCVSDQPDLASSQIYTYHLPPPNPPFAQQVQLPGSLCQTQPYFVPVLPQGYVMANSQQPPLCRYGNLPAAFLNCVYSPVPYISYSEMQCVETKSVEPMPTGAVEQL